MISKVTQALSQFFFSLADGNEGSNFHALVAAVVTVILLLLNACMLSYLVYTFFKSHVTARGAVRAHGRQRLAVQHAGRRAAALAQLRRLNNGAAPAAAAAAAPPPPPGVVGHNNTDNAVGAGGTDGGVQEIEASQQQANGINAVRLQGGAMDAVRLQADAMDAVWAEVAHIREGRRDEADAQNSQETEPSRSEGGDEVAGVGLGSTGVQAPPSEAPTRQKRQHSRGHGHGHSRRHGHGKGHRSRAGGGRSHRSGGRHHDHSHSSSRRSGRRKTPASNSQAASQDGTEPNNNNPQLQNRGSGQERCKGAATAGAVEVPKAGVGSSERIGTLQATGRPSRRDQQVVRMSGHRSQHSQSHRSRRAKKKSQQDDSSNRGR